MSDNLKNICKNCEKELHGHFCDTCGQRSSIHKVTFRETIQDLIETIFSIDAPFFITLKTLFVNPGRLFKEYLAGKRKKYYRPVTFFILMTFIYLVIREIINYDPFGDTNLNVVDETTSQLLTKARNYMLLNIDKLLFVFVLTLGTTLKIFFYKKYSFAEFLAISFFLTGVYTLLTTLNMFYIQYIDSTLQAIHIVVMLFYFVYAMLSLFPKRRIAVIIRSILAFILAFISYGFVAYGISLLIIWIKNN